MRIGLVARFLGMPIGLGTYAVELIQALDRRDDDNEYFLYTGGWNDVPALGPRFHVRRWPVPRGSRAAHAIWDLTVPPLAAAREPVDLVHYLHAAYPPFSPSYPVIINLLDAIRWMVPGYRLPAPYDRLERRAARNADLIVTLSEHARGDLQRALGLDAAKIRVTYLSGPPVDPAPSRTEPYFLFVGGTEKRKNLASVLDAFRSLEGDFRLRVVGKNTASPIHDARRDQPGVEWLGFVGEKELAELYRHATALVFPSRYEGFGLPVLEAMARHTPVIAADSSSIPEVARGAAILVDPDDVDGLLEAMRRVATEAPLREEMIRRGLDVAAGFTWDETARLTVAAYEEFGVRREHPSKAVESTARLR